MTASEAKALIDRKLDIEEADLNALSSLSSLLSHLEFLPLAITQTVAFMSENECGVAEYLDILTKCEDETIKLLSTDLLDGKRYSQIHNQYLESIIRPD
jgi:hypothetical protein